MRKSAPLIVAVLGLVLAGGASQAQTAANDTLTVAFAAEGTTMDPARRGSGRASPHW